MTYTNKTVHKIISKNMKRSAMYSGSIQGVGPRYCPSIEDKIKKFADKERHQIFLEPEGLMIIQFIRMESQHHYRLIFNKKYAVKSKV